MAHALYQFVAVPGYVHNDYPATTNKLCTLRLKGDFECLHGPRLRGERVWSMRTDGTGRLLFVLVGDPGARTLCFYKHLPTHNYDAAKRQIEADNEARMDLNQLAVGLDLLPIIEDEGDCDDVVIAADAAPHPGHIYYNGADIRLDGPQEMALKTKTTSQVLTGPPGSGKTIIMAARLALWANEAAAPGLSSIQSSGSHSSSSSFSTSSSSSAASSATVSFDTAVTTGPSIFYVTESEDLHDQMKNAMENQLSPDALAHIEYCNYESLLKRIDPDTHGKPFLSKAQSKERFFSDKEIKILLLMLTPTETKKRKGGAVTEKHVDMDMLFQEFLLIVGLSLQAYLNQGAATSYFAHLSLKERTHIFSVCINYCQQLKNDGIIDPQFYIPSTECFQTLRKIDNNLLIAVDEAQDYPPVPAMVMHQAAYEQRIVYGMDTHQQIDSHFRLSIRPYLIHQLKAEPSILTDSYRLPNVILDISNVTLKLKALASNKRMSDKEDYPVLERSDGQRARSKVGFVKWVTMSPAPQVKIPAASVHKAKGQKTTVTRAPHIPPNAHIIARLPTGEYLRDLIKITEGKANVAVITRPELVGELKKLLGKTPVMAPQDIKGLEYDTIITWDLLHDPSFHEANTLLPAEPLTAKSAQGCAKDKRSQLRQSACVTAFNAFYTAQTRTTRALYMYEFEDEHHLGKIVQAYRQTISGFGDDNNENDANRAGASSPKEWRELMNRYIRHGDLLNAHSIWADDSCWSDAPAERGTSFEAYRAQQLALTHPPKGNSVAPAAASSATSSSDASSSSDVSVMSSTNKGSKLRSRRKNSRTKALAQAHENRQSTIPSEVFSSSDASAMRLSNKGSKSRSRGQRSNTKTRAFKGQSSGVGVYGVYGDMDTLDINDIVKALFQGADLDEPSQSSSSNALGSGFEPSKKQIEDFFAAVLSASSGFEQGWLVGSLIEKNIALINAVNDNGQTMLHVIAAKLFPAALSMLKRFAGLSKEKGSLDVRDQDGQTALHVAVAVGNVAAVEALLQHGVDVTLTDNKGRTALHIAAAEFGSRGLEMLRHLVRPTKAKGSLDVRDQDGQTALHVAAAAGRVGPVEALFEHGADVTLTDNKGQTALHIAAAKFGFQALDILKCIIGPSRDKGSLDVRDQDGQTALHVAAAGGMAAFMESLLEDGADVTLLDHKGQTALHIAAAKCSPWTSEIFKRFVVIVEEKKFLNVQDQDGRTALHVAVAAKRADFIESLLEHGADVTLLDHQGRTALHIAAASSLFPERIEVLEHIVVAAKAKGILDVRDQDGQTALHVAVAVGNVAAVEALLQHGADVTLTDNKGQTALHIAAAKFGLRGLEMLRCLAGPTKAKGSLNVRDQDGRTALHMATAAGDVAAVEAFLQHGADVTVTDNKGQTALHIAAAEFGLRGLEMLMCLAGPTKAKGSLNVRDQDGQTALHMAVIARKVAIVEVLLKHGADVTLTDNKSQTALHIAAAKFGLWELEMLRCLVRLFKEKNGLDVRDQDGRTALHVAAARDVAVVEVFFNHGADVTLRDNKGRTALHVAAAEDVAVVEALLKHGADVTLRDNKGRTALHVAAAGDVAVVEALLKHGADVTLRDNKGRTALHVAAAAGDVAVVEALLKHGADETLQDNQGQTALYLAISNCTGKGFEIFKLLIAAFKAKGLLDVLANDGQSALHRAIHYSNKRIYRSLLEAGANPYMGFGQSNISTTHLARLLELGVPVTTRASCIDPRLMEALQAKQDMQAPHIDWLDQALNAWLERERLRVLFTELQVALDVKEVQDKTHEAIKHDFNRADVDFNEAVAHLAALPEPELTIFIRGLRFLNKQFTADEQQLSAAVSQLYERLEVQYRRLGAVTQIVSSAAVLSETAAAATSTSATQMPLMTGSSVFFAPDPTASAAPASVQTQTPARCPSR